MIWPPQSLDFSPIELLRDELDRNVCPRVKKMWQKLKSEWHKIDFQKLEDLLLRMARICKAVIAAIGDYIDESKL